MKRDLENRKVLLKWMIENDSIKLSGDGCWLWPRSKNKNGYGGVRGLDGKTRFAHRVSYQLFVEDIPEGMCVCHTCDRPSCVNPSHLWLGTRKQNSEDMVKKGRASREWHGGGFKRGHSLSRGRRIKKLTDDQVREIRASIEPLAVLAKRYGVSMSCVSTTRRGKRKQLVS